MADKASVKVKYDAWLAEVQAIGVVVPPPVGIVIGDRIAITVASGLRATAGLAVVQLPGGNEPIGSQAMVTAIAPADGMLWYEGVWGSGRTGYVRDSRVAEV